MSTSHQYLGTYINLIDSIESINIIYTYVYCVAVFPNAYWQETNNTAILKYRILLPFILIKVVYSWNWQIQCRTFFSSKFWALYSLSISCLVIRLYNLDKISRDSLLCSCRDTHSFISFIYLFAFFVYTHILHLFMYGVRIQACSEWHGSFHFIWFC